MSGTMPDLRSATVKKTGKFFAFMKFPLKSSTVENHYEKQFLYSISSILSLLWAYIFLSHIFFIKAVTESHQEQYCRYIVIG